ncbi:hypothetical protein BO86DRAFT_387619 [Aspergillus japonicus CBS 114.51]|uniref:Uncharacterized protein n=2 Tax=Aspergillus TaxID=5052 RepID=A0A2V5GS72_ASPV1|nr:hypothetical protein BO86DRAFT_387619 [Aspergillus japonicus CBS 114.51]PYI13621.1 hypothetical protein BO99DRAFT_407381 [Aspergillus violaceofuscus CBS 115571]RAH83775.1 hypothetical protein BO86DRAFT_387619 [Aspergillus japonicus CBS 114.51]
MLTIPGGYHAGLDAYRLTGIAHRPVDLTTLSKYERGRMQSRPEAVEAFPWTHGHSAPARDLPTVGLIRQDEQFWRMWLVPSDG